MNSRLDSILYAIEHPLGPSRELGSYANHQTSVENLIREIEARVHPDIFPGTRLRDKRSGQR